MITLGVRCSNKDFTFAVLDGTKESPKLIKTDTLSYPNGFTKQQSLTWLINEIENLIEKHKVEKVLMNKFEGRNRGNTYEDRVEHEAAVYIAAENQGIKYISKKTKGSIAKSLGLKGRASYLTTLDTSMIKDYEQYSDKSKDSIFAAWSILK